MDRKKEKKNKNKNGAEIEEGGEKEKGKNYYEFNSRFSSVFLDKRSCINA